MIYLDNAATTKPSDEVISEIEKNLRLFYNPSAQYKYANDILQKTEEIKSLILKKLNTQIGNIIFTGSATEANNLAILGTVRKNFKRLIFSIGEHPSVYNTAIELKEKGFDVQFVKLQKNGEIDYNHLEELLKVETSFCSIMYVSNETGAINDIKRACQLVKSKYPSAIFHTDSVQAFNKIPISVSNLNVDLLTMSAHKTQGPKGIGFLYCKNKNLLKPIIFGGGQEMGLRSGTENTPYIMSLKPMLAYNIEENLKYVNQLRNSFLSNLDSKINVNSSMDGSPYIVSLSLTGVKGETILHMLEQEDIIIGTGSACSSKKAIKNRVLYEMGVSSENIDGALRISFSKDNTEEEVILVANKISEFYNRLYSLVRLRK